MNDYERKQEERRQRYLDRADAAQAEAERLSREAFRMGGQIPLGQPILVGHHSEKRHRAHLARMDAKMRGCVEASKKADHYREKAAGVERAGISSDDSDAVKKLKEKLENLEGLQASMKAYNAAWRKAGKPGAEDEEGWKKFAELTGSTVERLQPLRASMARSPWEKNPHPSFALSNNGANIRRIKERIAQLEAAPTETVEKEVGGIQLIQNAEENRVQLIFPGKPDEETRKLLKRNGFRWSPRAGAWQRQLNNRAIWVAEHVLEQLNKKEIAQ